MSVRLLAAAVLFAAAPVATAQMAPFAPARPALPTDQPFASAWFPSTILAWSPASDPDAPYNRASVPLRSRLGAPGLQASAHARPGEGRVNPISAFAPTSGNPSQGSLSGNTYAFGYWPYVDDLVFWGGSAGEGLILAPNPGVVDAAHRHGVPVLGTVFFPPTVYGGQIQWVRDFAQRRGDTFPVADKLIEAATYYGFDGWFINQETAGGNAALASDLRDLMVYIQANSDLRVEWYDAMVESGPVAWQGGLNAQNDAFFQNGATRVSDRMFIDFRWNASSLTASAAAAQALGRDPYDLNAGVDYGARGLGIASSMAGVFPEGQPHRMGLGIYRPDNVVAGTRDLTEARDRALWVGADGDPSREDAGAWKGIAHYVATTPPALSVPFLTTFGTGQGTGYHVDGQNAAPDAWAETGWNNLSLQSLQPTWRWWVDAPGTPVSVQTDYAVAYDGGASVRLSGTPGTDQHIRLFATDAVLPSDARLDVAVRVAAAGAVPVEAGLIFSDVPGSVTRVPLAPATVAGWTHQTLPLAAYAGRRLVGLSLFVPAGPALDVNVGQIGIVDGRAAPQAPGAVVVERRTEESAEALSLRLTWGASASPVERYEVFRGLPGGGREFVWGTSGTAVFVPQVRRIVGQADIPIQVVAVGPTGLRSEAATVTVATYQAPAAAANPSPADASAGVPLGARLTWASVAGTTERTLRFGTTPTPPVVATPARRVFDPGPLAPNTAYYWRVDEANAAGATPGPLWSFTTGERAGVGASALMFDGTTDFVDLGTSPALRVSGSTITLEARIRPTAWRANVYEGSVLNMEQNGPDNGYAIRVGAGGRINALFGSGSWNEATSPPGVLRLNEWQHVAATYDGTTIRVYVDGEPVAQSVRTFSLAASTARLVAGGSQNNPSRTFPGGIDEVRVWRTARSAEAIRATMAETLGDGYTASPDSGLVGYWRFDEGSGQTVIDDSPTDALGTLGASTTAGDDDPAWDAAGSVGSETGASSLETALAPSYPNPAGRVATIPFSLATAGAVRLSVFDVLGREVAVLLDSAQAAGAHQARLDTGRLAVGTYVVRLTAGAAVLSRRLTVVR